MFDQIIAIDWSSSNTPSPRAPRKDAIFMGRLETGGETQVSYHRTRSDVMAQLVTILKAALDNSQRVLVGFDFGFGYPKGFAHALTGRDDPFAVWEWLQYAIQDDDLNANNRFEVADQINQKLGSVGPFWGCPTKSQTRYLRIKGREREPLAFPDRRAIESALKTAQPMWKLYTAGAVGGQSLVGLPRLAQLRTTFGSDLQVWPLETGFNTPSAPIVLAEIYPSLYSADHRTTDGSTIFDILDARQVRSVCEALSAIDLQTAFCVQAPQQAREEGWILGAFPVDQRPSPPPLSNDCFALPQGVHWTPVDEALAQLESRIHCVSKSETTPVNTAAGRILAQDVVAKRSNPAQPNCAVDGYGFAFESVQDSETVLDFVEGRAAAGGPYGETVPKGKAIRILTGAVLPRGVDTVVLEEDCTVTPTQVAFRAGFKRGANCRNAGEDFHEGDVVARARRVITASDLALISAAGLPAVQTRTRLRVAVLSTGDELQEAGQSGRGTYDANRPMLLELVRAWGFEAIDLGIVPDDEPALRASFDQGAEADVILTSGGASMGDEDHVSRLLSSSGNMTLWRIAMKPGRPLAMGMWKGVPVFGLPGNPVAALVCALIFARPALMKLAGADWIAPQGFTVPAAFSKAKKAGRREYLRARIRDGKAEVFASEGSGRISGLSWADGLVELPHEAITIERGDPVTFLPYASFGI